MTDLIRREDAIQSLRGRFCGDCKPGAKCDVCDTDTLIRDMMRVPAVDAVEVVRVPVKGYENEYEVDCLGRVFSKDRTVHVYDNGREYDKPLRGKQLRQTMHSEGYKVVVLVKDGKQKTVYVHRLVATAFTPNPNNLPFVNHKDEDKTNNFVENLEWCTAQYNSTYGNARRKQAKALIGKQHTQEHKKKISESLKRYYRTRKAHQSGEFDTT